MQYRSHNPHCDLIAYGNMQKIISNNPVLRFADHEYFENEFSRNENARQEQQIHRICRSYIYDLDWVEYCIVKPLTLPLIKEAGGFVDEVGVPLKMFFKNPTLFLPETKIQIIE